MVTFFYSVQLIACISGAYQMNPSRFTRIAGTIFDFRYFFYFFLLQTMSMINRKTFANTKRNKSQNINDRFNKNQFSRAARPAPDYSTKIIRETKKNANHKSEIVYMHRISFFFLNYFYDVDAQIEWKLVSRWRSVERERDRDRASGREKCSESNRARKQIRFCMHPINNEAMLVLLMDLIDWCVACCSGQMDKSRATMKDDKYASDTRRPIKCYSLFAPMIGFFLLHTIQWSPHQPHNSSAFKRN